ncbi:hypothetical protein IAG41_05300 [Sphingomonas sp. JC676]|uniref:hypothetical protein n=1 Tax=Sphingomonas sp. JC676 TaxID=2768065 RepID=UPI001657B2BF|nr:hypothetical protein [Sphingomonas sp. JC676]MBC9031802.1 hypothetical protein [Sphingomonas sp. JC676]
MRAVAFAAITLFLATPASAQDSLETYPQRSFGAWSVYGFQGDCWMVNDSVGGASVSFSTNPRDTDLYIAVENPAWGHIAADASLEVRLSLAGSDAVYAATGLARRGRGFSLFLKGAGDPRLTPLRATLGLGFAAPRIALDVPLADAGPAFDYMRQCTEEIRK